MHGRGTIASGTAWRVYKNYSPCQDRAFFLLSLLSRRLKLLFEITREGNDKQVTAVRKETVTREDEKSGRTARVNPSAWGGGIR